MRRGKKQSAETIAKRKAAMRLAWADAERREIWRQAVAEGVAEWHNDPDNAQAFAARVSDRMRRRHQDPEFRKRRDARSSATMKKTWERLRPHMCEVAAERYRRMAEDGTGLLSEKALKAKNRATQWIMKKAQEALHTETDYDATYAEVQARLRREMPYDGPANDSDYMDYLRNLGREVVMSIECREIADNFMSEAIPRFAAEWRARRSTLAA